MKRPDQNTLFRARSAENEKRELDPEPFPELIARLKETVRYEGYSKHKEFPKLYNLEPWSKERKGDETLCDRDAGFQVADMATIPVLLTRGIDSHLISKAKELGVPRLIWSIADNGVVYEARITNAEAALYHGYPLRYSDPFVRILLTRFEPWALEHGGQSAQVASELCKTRCKKAL